MKTKHTSLERLDGLMNMVKRSGEACKERLAAFKKKNDPIGVGLESTELRLFREFYQELSLIRSVLSEEAKSEEV